MKPFVIVLSFLFVFLIPFYDVPRTFKGGISISGIIGVILVIFILISYKSEVIKFPKSVSLAMYSFISIYSLSLFLNLTNLDDRAISHVFFYIYSFMIYTFIPYIVMSLFGVKWFVKVLSYSVIAVSFIGIVEIMTFYINGFNAYATFLNHGQNIGIYAGTFARLRSTFNEPSHYALFMVCVLPLLWYYKRYHGFFWGLLTTILTFSTSTMFGVIVASIIIAARYLFNLSKKAIKPIRLFSLGIISLIVVILGRIYVWDSLYEKIFNIENIDSYRYNAWIQSLRESIEKPFLGYGPTGYYANHELGLFNWYLQVFYESGVIGLSIIIVLLVIILKKILELQNNIFLFFYLTFIFSMFVMNHYYIPGIWILIAAVSHISSKSKKLAPTITQ